MLIGVLDDDPTGPQGAADVPVLLDWDAAAVRAVSGGPVAYLLTNTRALDPSEAKALTYAAARAVAEGAPGTAVIMRGDSTLRAHLVEEYLAVRDALHPGRWPALLLVPALPNAGRVTRDGVHYLEDAHGSRPLHETEYATDPAFGYPSADLLLWAEHRSEGIFRAADGTRVPLSVVRALDGAKHVRDALMANTGHPDRATVVVPDAETDADLAVIAAGWRLALAAGAEVLVRSGPAFAAVASGCAATRLVVQPRFARTLVVCGSHVPLAARQLEHLEAALGIRPIEVSAAALACRSPGVREGEVARAAAAVSGDLDARNVALLTTPRVRTSALRELLAGRDVAGGVAAVVASIPSPPTGAIVKGGITSATIARSGFGARTARVVGPVAPGVSLWQLQLPTGEVPFLVIPGNVGEDDTMTSLVRHSTSACEGFSL